MRAGGGLSTWTVEASPQPLLGIGQVRHARLWPVRHRFAYATYFLLLPLRRLREHASPALVRNRFGLISFHDRDHGDGREDCLAWVDELLAAEGIGDALAEVWLQCYPRVLGHAFKPVSFWYCHRCDGSLAAVVAEVNNTFGERHCYLLHGPQLGFGREMQADKVFHVSPFCEVAGRYRFRFMRTDARRDAATGRMEPARVVARVDHDDAKGRPVLQTSVSGELSPLTRRSALRAFAGMPLMSLGIVARIHWQAIRLWARRVPFFRKPPAPRTFLSR
jgi:DUF1365 family protein